VRAGGHAPIQALNLLSSLVSKSLVMREDAYGIGCYRRWYWITRANTEGCLLLDEFLAADGGAPRVRAYAWFLRGFLAVLKAESAAARPALLAAAAAARRAGEPGLLAEALSLVSITESLAGQHDRARELLGEAEAAAAGLDYPPGRLAICQARALGGLLRSDLDAARSGAAAGLSLARAADDMYGLEMMLLNLGAAALLGGDLNQAGPLLAEALDIADRTDDRVAQFYVLGALGCHAAFSARPGYAARLLGAADTAATEVGASVMPFLLPVLARAGQVAEAALGTARFQAERTAGEDLSRRAALELALGRSQRDHQADAAATERAGGSVQPLSNREADVARLLADGLTNRQIGARLYISERTVDSHVRSILNKLGFASRAQVAAWITSPD
jgi:DNA-binding CsgD family transcriptional regulator